MNSSQKTRLKNARKKVDEAQAIFADLAQERTEVISERADHDYCWLSSLEELMGHAMHNIDDVLARRNHRKTVEYLDESDE